MRVAIVYDRVNKWGGAERVLLTLHKMFPHAPLYTSVYSPEHAEWADAFPKIHTSFLQHIPHARTNHEYYATLMPLAFEAFDFTGYDLVISVTSEAAKGIITSGNTKHICYLLTPTRYLWSGYEQYFDISIKKAISKFPVAYLKSWDKRAAKRPDIIISISKEVAKRVKEFYGTDSEVIYPPANIPKKAAKPKKKNYYLVVSRLVPYKKVDLVVHVFNKLGKKLVIIGEGRQENKLKEVAKNNIKFVSRLSEERILIFGNGQIGNFYQRHFSKLNLDSKIAQADITELSQIKKALKGYDPSVVINTAAKTNLEWCVNNKLEAFNVNVLGADNVASVCDENGVFLVHLSSGCILSSKDENDAKSENDIPLPISYYSWTKVWAENLISFKKSKNFKYLILRPRQPVSAEVNHKNMLMKLLTFTKFIDTPNSGTVIEDLMKWTDILIDKRVTGVIHVANEGWTTPYEIGKLLQKHILPSLPVNKISKEELNHLTPEKRVDTVLNVKKLESIVGHVGSYKERLEDTIINLGKNLKSGEKKLINQEIKMTVEQSKTRTTTNTVWKNLLK